jgi:hypothetical protein
MSAPETAVGRRPRALPEWLVSSPHHRLPPRPNDRASRPHGLHHARRVGEHYTACGLPALNWPYFWGLAFGDEPGSTCPDCLVALADGRRSD